MLNNDQANSPSYWSHDLYYYCSFHAILLKCTLIANSVSWFNGLIGIYTRHVNVYNFCDQFQSTDMLETSGNQRSLAESRLWGSLTAALTRLSSAWEPWALSTSSHVTFVTLAKVTKLYEVSCMVIVAATHQAFRQGQSIVVMPLSITKMMTSLLLSTLLLTLTLTW